MICAGSVGVRAVDFNHGRKSFSRFEKLQFGGGALILEKAHLARGEALVEIFRRHGFVTVDEVP